MTTFTVSLATQPSAAVTVTLTRTGSGDVTFDTDPTTDGNQNTLDFSTSNWGAAQSVTVRASEDADRINDTAEINLTGNGNGVTSASLTVTVMDDEDTEVGLTLSLESTTQVVRIDEGNPNPRTLTLRLAAQPGNSRTVTLRSVYSRTMVSPSTLQFTTANWNAPQEFGITAERDADSVSAPDLIRLEGDGVTAGTVILSTIDYDGRAENRLVVSDASLTVEEGASETFTVRLGARPENDRRVSLSSGSSAVTVTPGALNFTADNWDDPQTATVTAVHDADQNNESATLSLSGFNMADASVAVSVLDDEDTDVGLTLSLKSLGKPRGMQEGGSTAFTVRLASRPVNDRTVTLESASSSVVTFNPSALQFNPGNWDEPQELRIIAGQDDDTENNAVRVTLGGAGVIARTIPLIIYDDDLTKIGLTLSATSLTVDEGGTGTFTVRLATTELKGPRVIFLESTKPDVTISPASLNFTSTNWNATWNAAQTVTVTGVHDDDAANGSATINLTGGSVTSASLAVTVIDDDAGLELSASSLTVDEGSSGTFTVKLASPPDGIRTVNLASSDTDVVTVSPAALEFTSTDWNSAKTVTVTGVDDDDTSDGSAAINLSGDGIAPGSVSVSVTDDDVGLILSSSSLTVDERASVTFTVKLTSKLDGNRTVNLASNSSKINVSPAALEFTSTDWNTAQIVTVRGNRDSDRENGSAVINLTGESIASASVTVTVIDKDVGLILSSSSLTVNEGASGTFTVKLASQPDGDLTVTPVSHIIRVSPTLHFTSTNWNTPQTVKVTVPHDDDAANGNVFVHLMGLKTASAWVEVSVIDDDVGLTLSSSSLTVKEGASGTFTVNLAAQPDANRTVNLASTHTDVTVSPAVLNFTSANWNTAQTVTVTAAHNNDAANGNAAINLTGENIGSASVTVTVKGSRLFLAQTSLKVWEGGLTSQFGVRLAMQPTADVTVTVSSNNVDVTVDTDHATTGSQNTLTFTRSNWETLQYVYLKAVDDADVIDESAIISLTAAGGGFDAETGSVTVSVLDNDFLQLLMTDGQPATTGVLNIEIVEGNDRDVKVKLAAAPSENVTVTLETLLNNPDVTFDTDAGDAGNQNTLTFTPSNWSTPQTVAVSVAQDTDRIDELQPIIFQLPNGAFESLLVLVYDDDIELDISQTSLTIDEGGSGTFTVKMNRDSMYIRKIILTSTNDDVTFSPTTLTFTSDPNRSDYWNTAQTVTVEAADDADAVDDTSTIGFEIRMTDSAGGHLVNTATDTVTVTVRDNDAGAAGFNISAIAPEAGDGGAGLFAVRLDDARPANGRLAGLGLGGDDAMSGIWSGDGAVPRLGEPGPGHQVTGVHRQYDRRRPEDQPHRIPRDRHVNFNLGFDHRRRHPTA